MVVSMNTCPSFTGRVDRSVYKYAKSVQNELQKTECLNAQQEKRAVPAEELKQIEQKMNTMLDVLKKKVSALHKDTVIAVEHNKADNNDYLVAYNKVLKSAPVQTPASKSMPWFENRMNGWQLDNLPLGKRMSLGLNERTYKQPIEILERRIEDLDETATDTKLLDSAISTLKAKTAKKSKTEADAILSVSKDLGLSDKYTKTLSEI